MKEETLIDRTIRFVKDTLKGDSTGHDWWHIHRVYNNAMFIAENEPEADLLTVKLAALLHDISDWKFNNGDHTAGSDTARKWLDSQNVEKSISMKVAEIIGEISFKGAKETSKLSSLEACIVQDADRLDAIGAIGIGRAFAYGGYTIREMHNPDIQPVIHKTFEQYKKSKSTTINHFYEKLLLLQGLMNTKTAKAMARKRHNFMLKFLNEFFLEWNSHDPKICNNQ